MTNKYLIILQLNPGIVESVHLVLMALTKSYRVVRWDGNLV